VVFHAEDGGTSLGNELYIADVRDTTRTATLLNEFEAGSGNFDYVNSMTLFGGDRCGR